MVSGLYNSESDELRYLHTEAMQDGYEAENDELRDFMACPACGDRTCDGGCLSVDPDLEYEWREDLSLADAYVTGWHDDGPQF